MKTVLKKKVVYLDLNFSYFLLLHNLWWHGWPLTSIIWHLSLQMTETAGIHWHRIELYLCRRGLKFIVPCNQEQRQSLMLIFVKFWWLREKIQGGGGGLGGGKGSNSQGNSWKSDSLCLWELLGEPFNLTKFHPNRINSLCHACLVLSRTQS